MSGSAVVEERDVEICFAENAGEKEVTGHANMVRSPMEMIFMVD